MKVVYKHPLTEEIHKHRHEAMLINKDIAKIVLTELEAERLAAELSDQGFSYVHKTHINGMTYMGVKLEVK